MDNFTYSPRKESLLSTILFVSFTVLLLIAAIFIWIMAFTLGKWYFIGVIITILWLVLLFVCLLFWNYKVTIEGGVLQIQNWRKKVKNISVADLNKKAYLDEGKSISKIVFFDEIHQQVVSIKFANSSTQEYLKSIGFTLQKATKYGRFFYQNGGPSKTQD